MSKVEKRGIDYLANIERAIEKKYGKEAVEDVRSSWDNEKEENYLRQIKEAAQIQYVSDHGLDKKEINGILVHQKLINKASFRTCPVCKVYSFKSKDDVYMTKFGCCFKCYVLNIEGR